jgi:hypothetical protein
MSYTTTSRILHLTAAEWQRLDELAEQPHLRPTRGHGPIVVSWRSLIKRIASGELDVVEHDRYELPAGLVEQAEAVEERQREQVQIEQASLSRRERQMPVKLQQLSMLDLEPA